MILKPNNISAVLLAILLVFALGGCTANVGSTDKNGLISHLTVDLQIPSDIEPGKASLLSMAVKKGDQPFEDAKLVEFDIWPEAHPESITTVAAQSSGAGIYTASQTFTAEGLYVVKCRLTSKDYEVMPAKRIAIGGKALEQLAAIEKQDDSAGAAPEEAGGGHH